MEGARAGVAPAARSHTAGEIYRARCRTHEAYHATTRSNPRATSGKEVVRKIKERLQQCIEGEHEKAKQAKQHSHEEGPMATFQKHWITPGAAVFTVHGPKVALLRLLTLGLKTTNVEYL